MTAISRFDFTFKKLWHGRYQITYTSPTTGKQWTVETTDMSHIDNVLYEDEPKTKDLTLLKNLCKNG